MTTTFDIFIDNILYANTTGYHPPMNHGNFSLCHEASSSYIHTNHSNERVSIAISPPLLQASKTITTFPLISVATKSPPH